MEAFDNAGFIIPEGIKTKRSNVAKVKRHYDQIALKINKDRFGFTGRSGVFDFYKTVFREDEVDQYKEHFNALEVKDLYRYYKTYWRTYQMSDHLPIWVELQIGYADEYLENKLSRRKT